MHFRCGRARACQPWNKSGSQMSGRFAPADSAGVRQDRPAGCRARKVQRAAWHVTPGSTSKTQVESMSLRKFSCLRANAWRATSGRSVCSSVRLLDQAR